MGAAGEVFRGCQGQEAGKGVAGEDAQCVDLHGGEGFERVFRRGFEQFAGAAGAQIVVPVLAEEDREIGAGDAFAAAFIAGLLRGATPVCAATLANAMGALVATGRGAGTRIPSREHLLAMLAAHPAALAVA